MLVDKITDYLKSLNVVPKGFEVRTGRIEATIKRAVMVMFPLNGFENTTNQRGFYEGNQQIIVRGPDPMETHDVAEALAEALRIEGEAVQIEGFVLKMMRPRGLPIIYPINDADFYECSVNFAIRAALAV